MLGIAPLSGAPISADATSTAVTPTPIALVANTQIAGSSGGGTSAAIDTTGATLLVLCASQYSGNHSIPTDSYGNTWYSLADLVCAAGNMQLWFTINPTVGTGHTFTVTGVFVVTQVAAFSGVTTLISPLEKGYTSVAGPTGATLQTGSITPSQANSLIITAVSNDITGGTFSINDSFTITNQFPYGFSTGQGAALAYLVQTTSTPVNPTWTFSLSASGSGAIIAAFGTAPTPLYAYASQTILESIQQANPPMVASQVVLEAIFPNPTLALPSPPAAYKVIQRNAAEYESNDLDEGYLAARILGSRNKYVFPGFLVNEYPVGVYATGIASPPVHIGTITGVGGVSSVGNLTIGYIIPDNTVDLNFNFTSTGYTPATGNATNFAFGNASQTVPIAGVFATGAVASTSFAVNDPLSGVNGTGYAGLFTSALPTGASATGAAQALSNEIDKTFAGVVATGNAGSPGRQAGINDVAVVATGAAQSLSAGISDLATGVAGTGGVGTFFVGFSSGVGAAGSAQALSDKIDYTGLSGASVTASVGNITARPSGTPTGVNGTGAAQTLAGDYLVYAAPTSASATAVAENFFSGTTYGINGTGAVQSLAAAISVSIPATAAATGQVGTLVANDRISILGNVGTGAAEALFDASQIAITGLYGTGSIGTFFVGFLNGVTATGATQSLFTTVSKPLTGLYATGEIGTLVSGILTPSVAATGAAQALTGQIAKPLIGVAGTGAIQNVGGFNANASPIGVSGEGEAGQVIPVAVIAGTSGSGAAQALTETTAKLLVGVEGTGIAQTIGVEFNSNATPIGIFGTAEAGQVIPVAVIAGTSGSGAAQALTETTAKLLVGAEGTGIAGISKDSVQTALTGIFGTGEAGQEIPVAVISGTSGSGAAQSITDFFSFSGAHGTGEIETLEIALDKAFLGVSGTGIFGDAIPVAVIDGVHGIGLVDNVTHVLDCFIDGVHGTGEVHTLFAALISGSVVREVLETDPSELVSAATIREALLTEHTTSILQSAGVIREIVTMNDPSILQSGGMVREVVTMNDPSILQSGGIIREVFTVNDPSIVRAGGMVREILISDGGKQYMPIILVVT